MERPAQGVRCLTGDRLGRIVRYKVGRHSVILHDSFALLFILAPNSCMIFGRLVVL